jgi:DNA-binding NarL/FixJ family response regulator
MMGTVVDASDDGIAFFDAAGRLTHLNPSLERVLRADPQSRLVLDAARDMAMAFGATGELHGAEVLHAHATIERRVATGGADYLLRATRGGAVLGPDGATIIVVHCRGRRPDDQALLRARFGLTSREAEVAALLASGSSNKAIATKLGVMESTARRHTEGVFRKLGVNSRAEVAAKVHGPI